VRLRFKFQNDENKRQGGDGALLDDSSCTTLLLTIYSFSGSQTGLVKVSGLDLIWNRYDGLEPVVSLPCLQFKKLSERNSDHNPENRKAVMLSLLARRYDMTSRHNVPNMDEYYLFQNR
jgi:hypothetical protein